MSKLAKSSASMSALKRSSKPIPKILETRNIKKSEEKLPEGEPGKSLGEYKLDLMKLE
jgi:hypothetical protein